MEVVWEKENKNLFMKKKHRIKRHKYSMRRNKSIFGVINMIRRRRRSFIIEEEKNDVKKHS